MKKKSTDFFNYGIYKNGDAEVLRKELEEARIPVKTVYSRTSIGREATAGAYWTAYKFLIRACDFQRVEEIRNNLNITPIEVGEPAPSPKIYGRTKYTLSRFFLIGTVIFYLALIAWNALLYNLKSSIDIDFLSGILIVGYFLFASLFTGSLIYIFLKDWFKNK